MHLTNIFYGDFYAVNHRDNPQIIDSQGNLLLEGIVGNVYMDDYMGDAIALRSIHGNAYFCRWDGQAPLLESIFGDANFSYWTGSAPRLKKITGYAKFQYYQGKVDLLEEVFHANFEHWNHNAPSLKRIVSDANFLNWKGKAPQLERIGGTLLCNSHNLTVTHHLDVHRIDFQWASGAMDHVRLDGRISLRSIISGSILEFDVSDYSLQNRLATCIPVLKLYGEELNRLRLEGSRYWVQIVRKILSSHWDQYEKISLEEILRLKSHALRRICLEIVKPSELMNLLQAERIAVAGIELDYFQYTDLGEKRAFTKYNVYETFHTKNHGSYNLSEIFAVKCWCSTTESEHWLFIDPRYKDCPLSAIASTFHIPKDDLPLIRCLKRQGDILIAEMKDKNEIGHSRGMKTILKTGESAYRLTPFDPLCDEVFEEVYAREFVAISSPFDPKIMNANDPIRASSAQPLTAVEYFSLLEAES